MLSSKMDISAQRIKDKIHEKKDNARGAFTSWDNFVLWLQVPGQAVDEDGKKIPGPVWSNEDLLPTSPEKQNWSWYNYVVFYFSLSFGNWTLGSTMIGIGLNWWQSILTIFLSQVGFVILKKHGQLIGADARIVDLFNRHVLQLALCKCLSYRIPCCWPKRLWHVGM